MTAARAHAPTTWCVDLTGPHRLARETAEDRAELAHGGPARLNRRRLLRAELATQWSVHPDSLRFHREALGGVRVTAPRAAFTSIAQREHMVAIAVSDHPLGVDLEPLGSVTASDIEGLCPAWPGIAPTSRWTAFEALGKLLSVGISIPADEVETRSVAAEDLQVAVAGHTVRIALFPCKDHQIAVAQFET